MTTHGRLEAVTFDAADLERTGAFWAAFTGWDVRIDEPEWTSLVTPAGQEVDFQLAPDHRAPQWPGQELPQQFHLDLLVRDIEAAAGRAVELGATRLATGASWITLADPAGHPFDVCHNDDVEGVGLYAATIDTPDASALARFYAALLGMEVTYDGPEGALAAGYGWSVMFQQVEAYTPPAWPDPARPQQAHLEVRVDDLDAVEQLATGLGATRLTADDDRFRVLADPDGHPFCITVVAEAT